MRSALILAVALFTTRTDSLAQGTRVADEGSFTISVGGRTAGRENFRISATTRGDVTEYVARADVTYGDRKVTPELRTGPDGAVVGYEVTTRSGASTESWRGSLTRGRLNATIASGRGTSAREYIVPAGTLVLELSLAEDDYGKVIGRGGRTAQALRTVVKAAAVKDNRRVLVDIVE